MTEPKSPPTLSDEQKKVVETFGQGIAVLAGAGSGKTTTLVLKCAELLKRKPDARIAAVSFTEKSASDLKAKLAPILATGTTRAHWISTIHGLCASIMREYPNEVDLDGEETMLSSVEAQMIWDRARQGIWSDDLPDEIRIALDQLLMRESRDSIFALLGRLRELESFGAVLLLQKSTSEFDRSLAQVSQYVLDRYHRAKKRRGALDFNDLERSAEKILNNEKIRDTYRARFDLVLVDEFQDTNPLQAKIILNFVKSDQSNLCVVGDPKQSIYRFRDADVSVFEEFCARLPVNVSLSRNFRSRPEILEFTNQVCERAFEVSGMKYEALVPQRASTGTPSILKLDLKNPVDLAKFIRAEVAKGVQLEQMAILLRRIRGNEKWLKALTGAKIPIAVGGGGFFWEDPRIRELVSFLKWWDNPANSLSGVVFLRAPWVGVSDHDLDQWVKNDPRLASSFFQSNYPLAKKLAPLRGKIIRPGALLWALLIDQATEDELGASLLGLWHRVEDWSARGLDFHEVVIELDSALQENRREREVPPPRNAGLIPVMTLHSAKGLEFDHVILLDLAGEARTPPAPLLFWDREKGIYLGGRDEEGGRLRQDPEEESWRESEKKKNLAESKRLFYVALTRAKERLILGFPEDLVAKKKAEAPPKKVKEVSPEAVYEKDNWRGWIEISGAATTDAEIDPSVEAEARSEISITPPRKARSPAQTTWKRPRHSVTEWNLLSRCERAYEWSFVRPPEAKTKKDFQSELVLDLEPGLTQREIGTRVHACLEKRDWDKLRELAQEVGNESRLSAPPLIAWAESSPLMVESDLSLNREVFRELPFEAPVSGEVLVGSIDRLVRVGNDFELIDFKVTQKAKAPAELLETYQTQMELYAWAVKKVLGTAKIDSFKARLVNLSSSGVTVVPVPLGNFSAELLAKNSSAIISGKAGLAQPSRHCGVCDFRAQCAEGQKFSPEN